MGENSFFKIGLLAFCFAGVLRADPPLESNLRSEAETYISRVEALVAPYTDRLVGADLCSHKPVEKTAPRCHSEGPGCASMAGWIVLAGLTPWAITGFCLAPLPTIPLWLGLPVGALVWHIGGTMDKKTAARRMERWLSEAHYNEVQRQAAKAREEFAWFDVFGWGDQPWSRAAFEAFEDVIRERSMVLMKALNDEVEHRHSVHLPPDEKDLSDLTDRYLRLWTIIALFDIEQRRFSSSFLGSSVREAKAAWGSNLSFGADECRIALIRMHP
jgi:hypothetical protein